MTNISLAMDLRDKQILKQAEELALEKNLNNYKEAHTYQGQRGDLYLFESKEHGKIAFLSTVNIDDRIFSQFDRETLFKQARLLMLDGYEIYNQIAKFDRSLNLRELIARPIQDFPDFNDF